MAEKIIILCLLLINLLKCESFSTIGADETSEYHMDTNWSKNNSVNWDSDYNTSKTFGSQDNARNSTSNWESRFNRHRSSSPTAQRSNSNNTELHNNGWRSNWKNSNSPSHRNPSHHLSRNHSWSPGRFRTHRYPSSNGHQRSKNRNHRYPSSKTTPKATRTVSHHYPSSSGTWHSRNIHFSSRSGSYRYPMSSGSSRYESRQSRYSSPPYQKTKSESKSHSYASSSSGRSRYRYGGYASWSSSSTESSVPKIYYGPNGFPVERPYTNDYRGHHRSGSYHGSNNNRWRTSASTIPYYNLPISIGSSTVKPYYHSRYIPGQISTEKNYYGPNGFPIEGPERRNQIHNFPKIEHSGNSTIPYHNFKISNTKSSNAFSRETPFNTSFIFSSMGQRNASLEANMFATKSHLNESYNYNNFNLSNNSSPKNASDSWFNTANVSYYASPKIAQAEDSVPSSTRSTNAYYDTHNATSYIWSTFSSLRPNKSSDQYSDDISTDRSSSLPKQDPVVNTINNDLSLDFVSKELKRTSKEDYKESKECTKESIINENTSQSREIKREIHEKFPSKNKLKSWLSELPWWFSVSIVV